jgi:hypothetical protein
VIGDYDAFSGSRWGDWPLPGDPISEETASNLMDVYEQVWVIEDAYNFVYGRMENMPMAEQVRSRNRLEFMAYLWRILDLPVFETKKEAA